MFRRIFLFSLLLGLLVFVLGGDALKGGPTQQQTFVVYEYTGWDATATATSCVYRHPGHATAALDDTCAINGMLTMVPAGYELYVTDFSVWITGNLTAANSRCSLELDTGAATAWGAGDTVAELVSVDIGDTTSLDNVGDTLSTAVNTVIDEDEWFRVEITQRAGDCTDVRGVYIQVTGVLSRKP